ncbi:MAG: hypothetical protein HKN48_07535 [Flavobacteriaceae bacterium]|nr:hypothetical protein [Flavobacteriaceae bacterium]
MSLRNLFFVTISVLFFQNISAQHNFEQSNHLGITGGLTFLNIETSNFETEQGEGYFLAFTTRGAFYDAFDLIYGISFVQTEIGILGRDITGESNNGLSQYVDYVLQSAQINLLGSFNIINDRLSIEFGPVLNVNGKMKLKRNGFENYVLRGYENLTAEQIQNVSRVNLHAAAGITAGLENFRLSAQYQYGATNLFNRLNDLDIEQPANSKFEGNTGTLIFAVVVYF